MMIGLVQRGASVRFLFLGANFQREELLCDEKGRILSGLLLGGKGLFQYWNR